MTEARSSIPPSDGAARRRVLDRRQAPTPRVSAFSFFHGRRSSVRRDYEREGSFVDLHGFRLWCLVLWIALMNVGDSYFTLLHLQSGGIELNPMARVLLGTGRESFVLVKSIFIGLALVVLCIHKNFFLARIGIWTAAGTYTMLVLYHLTLFRVP